MPYVDAREIRFLRSDSLVTVFSPFWSVTHDLDLGGAPIEIHFKNGGGANALREPMSAWVDKFSDTACADTKCRHRRLPNAIEVIFEGSLCDEKHKPSAARFKTTYVYTPYSIRREFALRTPASFKAKTVCPLRVTLDDRFTHYSAANDPHTGSTPWESILGPGYFAPIQAVPSRRGSFFSDSWPPGWITFLKAGGEAVQIIPCGDLSAWDAPAGQAGRGRFALARQDGAFEIAMDALRADRAAALPRKLAFAASIGLVNLPAFHPEPVRMSMIGNPPFPSDALLKAWAQSGVQLLVIMEGTRWVGGRDPSPTGSGYWLNDTDRFWRMGGYPPYRDSADMRDLKRLVNSAHRLGMKVVPYTAPAEVNPELPAFSKNIRQWRQQVVPNAGTAYHPTGNYPGAVYGGLVCPDSKGMRDYYLGFVKKYVVNHNFDGIYVDLASKVYCHNILHGPAHHGGIDGLWGALGKARDFLGKDKIIVAHNGDCNMMVTLSNLADSVVTMESLNTPNEVEWNLGKIHPYIRAFPACAVLMIPNYSWYHSASAATRKVMQDGIAKGLLIGSVPFHLDIYYDAVRWGYKNALEDIRDDNGIWGLFRRLKGLRLEGLHFDDCFSNAVRTNRRGVLGARFHDERKQVLILANLTNRPQRNVRWQCEGASGNIGALQPKQYCFKALALNRGGPGQ